MFTEATTTIAEYVAALGLDATKDRFKVKIDEIKLRSSLIDYVERQRKYNEMCTLAEEIDFQGLVEYIQDNLLEDIGIRIFDPNRKRRGRARQEIVDAAIAYSKASTNESKYRVSKCISSCLDIIRGFYESHHLSMKDYILADLIADAVAEEVQESTLTTVVAVNTAKDAILAKIDDNGSLFSIDKAIALAEAGNVGSIGTGIRKMLDHISLSHPYYPDFGYDYQDGILCSKPHTAEAKKLYPPKFVLTGAVRFGDQYYNDADGNPLDYSYRHQLPITMEVSKAIKYLGEKPDPSQEEVKGIVGSTIIAVPPEFPPAFPCDIKVGEKTFFSNILMRTQEIEDDGTYIISNKEQGGSFFFEVRINPAKPSKPDFKVSMNHATNRELLNYAQFMSTLFKEKDLHIFVLAAGEDVIAGYINDMEYKTGFTSVDEEIDFLERVCAIEDYFNVTLSPDGEISQGEYDAVLRISDLIRNEEIKGTWREATFTGILDKHFREELISMDKNLYMFSYVGISKVELFGATFEFRFMRTFNCARMVDFEKVKRKAEVLDDGDDIKITFRAGDDNGTIDTLKIPDKIERAS